MYREKPWPLIIEPLKLLYMQLPTFSIIPFSGSCGCETIFLVNLIGCFMACPREYREVSRMREGFPSLASRNLRHSGTVGLSARFALKIQHAQFWVHTSGKETLTADISAALCLSTEKRIH